MKRTVAALAAIALVLALSTGAFAARKYLITSSSQIKPGTISYANLSANAKRRLAGKPGAAGPQGPKGDAGAPGATGAAGAAGAKGATGSTGAAGSAGPKGDAGADGADGADGTNALAQSSGLVAWTGDPGLILYEARDTSGTIHGSSVRLTAGQVVTSLSELVVTAGAAMTRGQYAIYDKNLNLVANTANTPAAFEVSGWVELPLTSPYTVPATDRYYFVDLIAATTSSTTPVFGLLGFNTATAVRGTLPGGALRNLASTGLSAFPATLVPSSTSITRAILAR